MRRSSPGIKQPPVSLARVILMALAAAAALATAGCAASQPAPTVPSLQHRPAAAQSQADALDRAGIQGGNRHDSHAAPTPDQLRQLVAFARCMRAHGLPSLADPSPATG